MGYSILAAIKLKIKMRILMKFNWILVLLQIKLIIELLYKKKYDLKWEAYYNKVDKIFFLDYLGSSIGSIGSLL